MFYTLFLVLGDSSGKKKNIQNIPSSGIWHSLRGNRFSIYVYIRHAYTDNVYTHTHGYVKI
jgi:hypothetical protein